jgi:hypothetical protein
MLRLNAVVIVLPTVTTFIKVGGHEESQVERAPNHDSTSSSSSSVMMATEYVDFAPLLRLHSDHCDGNAHIKCALRLTDISADL